VTHIPLSSAQKAQIRIGRVLSSAPRPLVERALREPVVLDGQTLDPQVQAMCRVDSMIPPYRGRAPEEARAQVEVIAQLSVLPAPRPARVRYLEIDGPRGPIPLCIEWPVLSDTPLPALLFLHGGGYCVGSIDSHRPFARQMGADARCVVVSVDYRLAPEHAFPAAVEDCLAAFRWLATHGEGLGVDTSRIAVGGDSAGGCLSTVVALSTREEPVRPRFQLLIYPGTDVHSESWSRSAFAHGFVLDQPTIDWFLRNYLQGADGDDWRCSPLRAPDLSGLPPAFVATAGFDPLRDEGEAYAERMRAAGVDVELRRYPSLVHAFLHLTKIVAAREAVDEMAGALRAALWS